MLVASGPDTTLAMEIWCTVHKMKKNKKTVGLQPKNVYSLVAALASNAVKLCQDLRLLMSNFKKSVTFFVQISYFYILIRLKCFSIRHL